MSEQALGSAFVALAVLAALYLRRGGVQKTAAGYRAWYARFPKEMRPAEWWSSEPAVRFFLIVGVAGWFLCGLAMAFGLGHPR